MPDPVSREEKGKWFKELTDLQESIAGERTANMKGKTYRVLVEGTAKGEGMLSGRTGGNIIIEFPGDESLIGEEIVTNEISSKFRVDVRIHILIQLGK